MAKIVPFKRPDRRKRADGLTLCQSGFHKWRTESGTPFDPKQGKLVTRLTCARCGATKTKAL
ncbi:MAG: hypothetical protein AAGA11_21330 [Pseudomonadota bacterium]